MIKADRLEKEVLGLISALPKSKKVFEHITGDTETMDLVDQANKVAILRWGFNDHGVVHALITTRNTVQMALALRDAGVELSAQGELGVEFDEALAATLAAALVHDLGNMAVRHDHEWASAILAVDTLRKALRDCGVGHRLLGYSLECILCHMGNNRPTSTEAKLVSMADALDMEKGRARLPYKLSGPDIHKFSAMAVTSVEIGRGKKKPLSITIKMKGREGTFQVESVLMKKADAADFQELAELTAVVDGTKIEYF